MKKNFRKNVSIKTVLCLALSAVCVLGIVKNPGAFLNLMGKAAVLSASTVIPTALEIKNESGKKADDPGTDKAPEKEKEDEDNNEVTTEAKKNIQPVSDISELIDSSFTSIPDDIEKLVKQARDNAESDKKAGSITEQTYKTSGVTDSYKNVKVKNVNRTKVDIKKLLGEEADLKITDRSKPTVLIFHTHTTERYQLIDRNFYSTSYTPRTNDKSQNMVRVGDAICEQLEKAGYNVIHDRIIHDSKYTGSYAHSRAQIEKYLEKYPDIQIVLDIHRDAIQLSNGTKIKPVTEINGKKCAQIMIISGCQEAGNGVSDFPDWEYNLVFGLQLQKSLEDLFSGITRPLYFSPRKYNMNMSHCSLLIEMGSDANTLDEAVYAGKCLGVALASLMRNYDQSQ